MIWLTALLEYLWMLNNYSIIKQESLYFSCYFCIVLSILIILLDYTTATTKMMVAIVPNKQAVTLCDKSSCIGA